METRELIVTCRERLVKNLFWDVGHATTVFYPIAVYNFFTQSSVYLCHQRFFERKDTLRLNSLTSRLVLKQES